MGNGFMIIDGEVPTPNSAKLDIEAWGMAADIAKDLDLIVASKKDVMEYDIGGETYILPKDFVTGLDKLREETISSLSLGRYGESEMLDNIALYDAERNGKINALTEEQKSMILSQIEVPKDHLDHPDPRIALKSAFTNSLAKSASITAILVGTNLAVNFFELANLWGFSIMGPVTGSVALGGVIFASMMGGGGNDI